MVEWFKVLFSGFGGNLIIFVLGLIVGGGAGFVAGIHKGKLSVEKGGQAAEVSDGSENIMKQKGKKRTSQIAVVTKKSKNNMEQSD